MKINPTAHYLHIITIRFINVKGKIMNKILSILSLIGCSVAFADNPNPYLAIQNGTKATTVVISYETKSGYGTVTLPPGINKGVPVFPDGEEVKNINFVLFGGKIIDQHTCGFIFDEYYKFVNIKFQSTLFTPDGEHVNANCSFN